MLPANFEFALGIDQSFRHPPKWTVYRIDETGFHFDIRDRQRERYCAENSKFTGEGQKSSCDVGKRGSEPDRRVTKPNKG